LVVFVALFNTMTMSVTERTREIGTLSALGTYPNEIVLGFMREAGLLALIGAAFGGILTALTSVLTANVTPQQISLLHTQTSFLLLNQQQVQIFLQSQLVHKQLQLSPDLAKIVSTWLAQHNKQSKGQLNSPPAKLVSLLLQELGITSSELPNRIKHMSLQQQLLSLSFLQGDAVITAPIMSRGSNANTEQLSQLLQFIIPLSDNSSSSVRFMMDKDDNDLSHHKQENEAGKKIELTFNLEKLGTFKVKVELLDFQLSTQCIYSNLALEQKVKKHWPLLSERLNKLGFEVQNTFVYQPEMTTENVSTNNQSGLINVKV